MLYKHVLLIQWVYHIRDIGSYWDDILYIVKNGNRVSIQKLSVLLGKFYIGYVYKGVPFHDVKH